jgi:hypothetical protein
MKDSFLSAGSFCFSIYKKGKQLFHGEMYMDEETFLEGFLFVCM